MKSTVPVFGRSGASCCGLMVMENECSKRMMKHHLVDQKKFLQTYLAEQVHHEPQSLELYKLIVQLEYVLSSLICSDEEKSYD